MQLYGTYVQSEIFKKKSEKANQRIDFLTSACQLHIDINT